MEGELGFALRAADLADAIALPRFRALDLSVETKLDLSPVTDADRAVERAFRELVAAERPGEAVFGEEEGGSADAVRWIVDPIDGTRNFSRGIPIWAFLLALERDGELVVAVVSAPALGRRWWATRGGGARADGTPVHVSRVERLEHATIAATSARDLGSLEPEVWHARGLGDFWQHVLVAEGSLDAAVDQQLQLWDYAAVQLLVEEAGGRMTGFDGGPPRPGEQLVSSNGRLHATVLESLRG
jgi:histidinol-phosphatase